MKRTLGAVLCFSLAASFALAKDKPKKVDLAKLKPSIAEGWSGEFNPALQSWTFEKYTPGPDEMNVPNRFYLDAFPGDRPKDVEGYARKLQKDKTFQDFGSLFISVAEKTKLPSGWLITGVQKYLDDAEDKGQPAFVLYREDLGVYCRGSVFMSEAVRAEAIEACKTLTP
ncbi:MAG: hypothetical protein JNM69_23325 [Archangium sp.]|nr:hypothetical protein [Archangium sp.]